MRYCLRCLQPDTRPAIEFGPDGVCPACTYSVSLGKVDWNARREELQAAIAPHRRRGKSGFDCIVGVSGGKDSTRQSLWVRDKLELQPLLVCVGYPPRQLSDRGAENLGNLIDLGFDVVSINPAPETWRQMMKVSFAKFTNWARSTELALFSGVPRLAIDYGISLILWGENPALQLGDMGTLGQTGYDGSNLRNANTLSGGADAWLRDAGFTDDQLISYRYPSLQEFEDANIELFYMGWALGDWSLVNNAIVSGLNGLEFRDDGPENTGDLFGVTALDEDWVTLNQMIKYYKFGFGRATDYMNEEIRQGRITRDDACEIVATYDGACSDDYIEQFCDFIDIDIADFWEQVRANTNADLFEVPPSGRPCPRFVVGH
ncbi:MAG: N-acetyl sugar amidotransferase [Candidatus Nanopelagicales bacterium]|nr:N-acetyl sugar amidotransferase [Candidatus Nanopelagicales bacterium]MDZ4248945.1 N-acetyl sugar amidotransferase [Candidatus Nanopelagicales bacterium]